MREDQGKLRSQGGTRKRPRKTEETRRDEGKVREGPVKAKKDQVRPEKTRSDAKV